MKTDDDVIGKKWLHMLHGRHGTADRSHCKIASLLASQAGVKIPPPIMRQAIDRGDSAAEVTEKQSTKTGNTITGNCGIVLRSGIKRCGIDFALIRTLVKALQLYNNQFLGELLPPNKLAFFCDCLRMLG